MDLTSRKEKILSSVVTSYVRQGEPVGSKAIADEIGVSSATVRNEMAELTDLGYLEQPHTSAGRIPSAKGYRCYVDHYMEVPRLREEEMRYLDSLLTDSAYDPDRLLERACKALAQVTTAAAAATTPSGAYAQVKAVQFVQTSRRTAMLILMSSAGTMKNRVFHCDYDLTTEILRMFFRVFNEKVTGKDVSDITPAFLQSMGVSLGQLSVLAGPALVALLEVARDTMEAELFLSGQMNLLFYPELEQGGLRGVMHFMEQREAFKALLSQKPGKVTVMIGEENPAPQLWQMAVFIARYPVAGQDAGALAVLSPVRMDYPGTMAMLQYLSRRVGEMLTLLLKEEG